MKDIFFDLNRGWSFLRDHGGSLLGCHCQLSVPSFRASHRNHAEMVKG